MGFNGADAGSICSICGIGMENPVFSFTDTDKMMQTIRELAENYRVNHNGFLALSSLYEFFSMIQGMENLPARGVQLIDLALDYINKNYSYGLPFPR